MLPPLVADVNIASRVVQFLRSRGMDVRSDIDLIKENKKLYDIISIVGREFRLPPTFWKKISAAFDTKRDIEKKAQQQKQRADKKVTSLTHNLEAELSNR